MPSINLASVVLPLPLSPATAMMPGFSRGIPKLTSSTATVIFRRSSPPPKTLETFRSSRTLSVPLVEDGANASAVWVANYEPLSYMWQATHRRVSISFR